MRTSHRCAAIDVFVTLSGAPAVDLTEPEPSRPNIVLILADDMGFSDIGCYGGEIRTPTLDRLAGGGLRFTQFYNVARCCPTRAALLTGVYPHQAGVGLMTGDRGLPGFRGTLGRNVQTIAEALRRGGYRAYMAGKWHVAQHTGPDGPKHGWPLQRGFEKLYGTITGAGSYFDPATLCRGNTYITPVNDAEYHPAVYYYTDAISDHAVRFLAGHAAHSSEEPFFLYVAYTAAHWPMSAGTDDWEKTPHQDWERRSMEVYAAMIDRMDQGIGRSIAELERQEILGETLIFYLQDNGGCAEAYGRDAPKDSYPTDLQPMGADELQTKIWPPMQTRDGRPVRVGPGVMAGAEDTFISYGRGWANVSNTPFRRFKHFAHEGGISTPLIVHWPEGIDASLAGGLVRDPGHVIDLMATCRPKTRPG